MSAGVPTGLLATTALIDEVLGNRDGNTGRQAVSDLAAQLAAAGALAEALAAKIGPEALEPLIDELAALTATAYTDAPRFDTTVAGLAGTAEGDFFRVLSTDPAVSSYIYRHDSGPVATLVETVPSADALATKAAQAQVDEIEAEVDEIAPRAAVLRSVPAYAGPPAILSANGAVILTWDSAGRAILTLSPASLAALVAEAAATGQLADAAQLSDVVARSAGMLQRDSAPLPGIFAGRAELLGFDPATGEARMRVSQDMANQVLAKLGGSLAPYDPVAANLLPSATIAMFGDSMSPEAVRSRLATKLGRTVERYAVGGMTTRAIGELQGGLPLPVRVEGGVLPADGSEVDLRPFAETISPLDGRPATNPYNNQTSSTRAGTLLGVPVVLRRYSDGDNSDPSLRWTLRLALPGEALAVPNDSVVTLDQAIYARPLTQIIQSGRNDWSSLTTRQAIVQAREGIEAMVRWLSPGLKRFLIMSVHTGVGQGAGTAAHTQITAFNDELAATFGAAFCDMRRYMVDHAIYDALDQGLIAEITADDLDDIASDTIPRTLISSDGVHYEDVGWEMSAQYQARQIQARGW